MQPIPPEKGPSFREMQQSYASVWKDRASLRCEVETLRGEVEQLKRSKEALRIYSETLKKRLSNLQSSIATSATRPSHPVPPKRPLQPGMVTEGVKPRPSSSASRSSQPAIQETKRGRWMGNH